MKGSKYIALIGIILTGFLLVGCGDGDTNRLGGTKSEPKEETKTLTILTWEDYLAPEVIAEYTKRTGVEIKMEYFENSEELIAMVSAFSSKYDVLIYDTSSINRMANAKLVGEIDKTKFKNWKNLDEKFLDAMDPGNKYSVPYLWGSMVVAYRKDKVADPGDSLKILFDEQYKDRVFMLNDPVDLFAMAHLLEGRSINSYGEKELQMAANVLHRQVEKVNAKYVSDKVIRNGLLSGECWVAHIYSGDAAWVAEDEENIGYFFPKEGGHLWVDIMGVSRDSKNADAAHDFIDFMLEPDIGALNANEQWYATPNKAARPLLDEELVADEALILPQEVQERCELIGRVPEGALTTISRLMGDILSAGAKPPVVGAK